MDDSNNTPWTVSEETQVKLYPYVVSDKSIVKIVESKKKNEDGTETTEQKPVDVSNFVARIEEVVTHDDGLVQSTEYKITINSESRPNSFNVTVPANEFSSIKWAQEKGGPDLLTSPTVKNANSHIRHVIQSISGVPPTRTIYKHTGWRDGKYLFPGTDSCSVELPDGFERYKLPNVAENPAEAMLNSIQYGLYGKDYAQFRITAPLWGCIFRAPLIQALPLPSSLWQVGGTGSLKSAMAALELCHYGRFDYKSLPANFFMSTSNALTYQLYLMKDAVLVIDEFKPDVAHDPQAERKAGEVIRAIGNVTARQRLDREAAGLRQAHIPRCAAIMTAESKPIGLSSGARYFVVEMQKGDIDFKNYIPALKQAQKYFPHAMRGYLDWLAPQMDKMDTLTEYLEDLQLKKLQQVQADHLRIATSAADYFIGIHMGLKYAVEIGAVTEKIASALEDKSWTILLETASKHSEENQKQLPIRRFLVQLNSLLVNQRVWLKPLESGLPLEASLKSQFCGWHDTEAIYLEPDSAFVEVVKACKEGQQPFEVRLNELIKSFAEKGISESNHGNRYNIKIKTPGRDQSQLKTVVKLNRRKIFELIGEDILPNQVGGETYASSSALAEQRIN